MVPAQPPWSADNHAAPPVWRSDRKTCSAQSHRSTKIGNEHRCILSWAEEPANYHGYTFDSRDLVPDLRTGWARTGEGSGCDDDLLDGVLRGQSSCLKYFIRA